MRRPLALLLERLRPRPTTALEPSPPDVGELARDAIDRDRLVMMRDALRAIEESGGDPVRVGAARRMLFGELSARERAAFAAIVAEGGDDRDMALVAARAGDEACRRQMLGARFMESTDEQERDALLREALNV